MLRHESEYIANPVLCIILAEHSLVLSRAGSAIAFRIIVFQPLRSRLTDLGKMLAVGNLCLTPRTFMRILHTHDKNSSCMSVSTDIHPVPAAELTRYGRYGWCRSCFCHCNLYFVDNPSCCTHVVLISYSSRMIPCDSPIKIPSFSSNPHSSARCV